ncbi:MAG TPA: class I SAM-dependent methyltransferase [Thermoleophilaceae bacterium]|nr:class I SAM-dependent methyltransferase [Thermoleophilaceae bacterium]
MALSLGAAESGGPLSPEERLLVAEGVAWPEEIGEGTVRAVRQSILAGADPLGDELMRLRSPQSRRSQGAFYTPAAIVGPMVSWTAARTPARLVDAGCGSGRFALEAARRLPAVEILAVDLDPVATLLTRANMAAAGFGNATVINGDYLTLQLPSIEGRTAWIGNPPYLRHHGLPAATKQWAAEAARQIGHPVSSLAGLHAIFFLATALQARRGDIGTYIVSAEWLDTGYGDVVRKLLTNGLGALSLHVFPPSSAAFDGVMTSAVIVTFEAGARPDKVRLERVERAEDLDGLSGGWELDRSALTAASRWSPLFGRSSADPVPPPSGQAVAFDLGREVSASSRPPIRLGDLARVHRGQVTGANVFFSMTRREAQELGLEQWCGSAITSAEEILDSGGVVRDGPERRVVLLPPKDVDRAAHPALDRHLRRGERRRKGRPAVREGYVARHRNPWWFLGPMRPPPIVASYMARRAPVFALNPDRLVLLNVAHGVWPKEDLSDQELAELVRHLNAHRTTFVGAGRTYHGGLEKFEPREMENLVIPDPERIRRLIRLAKGMPGLAKDDPQR